MAKNRRVLLKILSSLARQALALRGHDDDSDGNLVQLLKLHSEGDGGSPRMVAEEDKEIFIP